MTRPGTRPSGVSEMQPRSLGTVLVTGSTDGIGKATALRLARDGFGVVLHGRSEARCRRALAELREVGGGGEVAYVCADLASLAEVRALAQEVRERFGSLSVLINNAGVYEAERRITVDGVERTFAVNHLAPFLLTRSLLDVLEGNGPSRIINVSSMAHAAHLDLDNLTDPRPYSGHEAYAQSKLANILFTRMLAARTQDRGVTVNCLHPGVVGTKLLRAGWGMGGVSVEQGARTSVYLASSPEVAGVRGEYFVERRVAEPAEEARDERVQRALWELSASLCGQGASV